MEMLEIGKKYGCLTVLKYEGKGKNREHRYICRCDCGNTDSFAMTPSLLNRAHCRKCAVRIRERNSIILMPGDRYRHLTVIEEAPKDKNGNRMYFCRCDCGGVKSYPASSILHGKSTYCRECVPHLGGYPAPDLAGKRINGWDVIEEVSRKPRENGTGLKYIYRCRCLRCGKESLRSPNAIRQSRSGKCQNCTPIYNFVIDGDTAIGTLPDGTRFLIDRGDIPRVNSLYWQKDSDGYIISPKRGETSQRLHRFILGIDDDGVIIDHINRNRLDNRKANLRIISTFGNSCNHSKNSANRTGYIGVYFSKHSQRYEVKVGYHRKRIKLGSSRDDLITLAQMYNVAARYLFGEFVGELNDVPDPSPGIIEEVIQQCRRYEEAPAAIQRADAFLMEGIA